NDKKLLFNKIGSVNKTNTVSIKTSDNQIKLDIAKYRKAWFKTSYLLDRKQTTPSLADSRYELFDNNELDYKFPSSFKGKFSSYNIEKSRKASSGIKAAIIREKGVNGDREMAYSMYLAGLDVKDVHMTDLISGRETLEDVNMIVFVGGFSNSDVLGSAKGWAGAFLYNPKAKEALDKFYARKDTISLGVCNGCQLMIELDLIKATDAKASVSMKHNESGKFESSFLGVDVPGSNSIMLKTLKDSRLGIWVAHGEGKFEIDGGANNFNVALKYTSNSYPANPNGSDEAIAGICSPDGRHLAMMPHLERAIFPWNWGYYPADRNEDEVTPWIEAFVNARKWIQKNS
ncbi:MAG: phosphoribosylformylglycinamidine synthase subunit PurQ, partial [Bacteroidales bacterium]|nr:phosphoribosylformylglycinamidine synthase subunit PurQ [Bacteroidales bacterium]